MISAPSTGAPAPDLARSTAAMTALTLVSRITGFVRILVVAAVLGTTFLGNTYQSANTVPNLLFELFAAGVIQAVLIPTLVELLDRGDDDEASHVAGSVLGLAAAGLAALAALGMLAAPWVMRALVAGVDDPAVQDAQVRLGTVLLWFFLPQVVFYAAGMVATGVLNARGRFALPTFAPVVNNVVVTASYGVFWLLRDGARPSLDLSTAEKVVLGGGTTVGVLAFCAVPVVAVVRSGFSLRPRFDARHPAVRRIARLGAWAALYLAATQVLLAVVLVLANEVEGGVVAYQVAHTFFLLPHALFALPVLTTLFPTLSRHAGARDGDRYGATVAVGVRTIAFLVLPASAFLVALARPLADLLLFGESAGDGADQVTRVVIGFAPGLLGYGAFLFLTRAAYATGDTRTPAMVNAVLVAGAAAAMAVAFGVVPDDQRVAALAAVHSVAYVVGAIVLHRLVARRAPGPPAAVARSVAVAVAGATLAGFVMWLVQQPIDVTGRAGDLVALAVAAPIGLAVYLGVQAITGTRLSTVAGMLRGDGG